MENCCRSVETSLRDRCQDKLIIIIIIIIISSSSSSSINITINNNNNNNNKQHLYSANSVKFIGASQ